MNAMQIMIVVDVIIAVIALTMLGWWILKDVTFIGKPRGAVEMKGDLVAEQVVPEPEETAPLPKTVRRTADYDLPETWVIFSYQKVLEKWSCEECGTENMRADTSCIVCGLKKDR